MIAAVLCLLVPLAARQESDALPAADPAITRAELEHHVRFLASEALGGRRAGTPEADRAARYLARALEAAGLAPGGDDGTFLQGIPATRVLERSPPKLVTTATSGEHGEAALGVDFNLIVRGQAPSTGELPVRYVRVEKDLPEHAVPEEALFFEGSPLQRAEWFAWRGLGDGEGFGLDIVLASGELGSLVPGRGKGAAPPRIELGPGAPEGCERILVRGVLRERLLQHLVASVELCCDEERTPSRELNVIGILRGASDDALLLCASYDHEDSQRNRRGEREGVSHPGADEASPCAVLLELAQALAHGPPPARTIVFLFVTGSRQERFGARYYLDHPALPLERTRLVLDLEGLGLAASPDEKGLVFLTGVERSNVGAPLVAAGLVADDDRQAHRYQRHAGYVFALAGIVEHSLWSTPHEALKPRENRPEKLEYEHLELASRTLLGAVERVLALPEVPAWTASGRPFDPADYGKEPEGDGD